MGYTTKFEGSFTITPTLTKEHQDYLIGFSKTRRMKRIVTKVKKLPDPIRIAAGLPIGEEGGYFIGEGDDQSKKIMDDDSIKDLNKPPKDQPGLWCQWIPFNNFSLEWDRGEKFYNYTLWLEYIIKHFLKRWGYNLNGEVIWYGENSEDIGKIIIKENKILIKSGKIVYEE